MILEATGSGEPNVWVLVLLALQASLAVIGALGLWALNDLRARVKRLEDQFFK